MTTADTSLSTPLTMIRRDNAQHITWVNKELDRVNSEMKAIAYTASFSVVGISITTALLFVLH
jgi:hypothetical protein